LIYNGTKAQDLGRLIAFVLTYDPARTLVKTKFADELLRYAAAELGVEAEEVYHHRDMEFKAIAHRRRGSEPLEK